MFSKSKCLCILLMSGRMKENPQPTLQTRVSSVISLEIIFFCKFLGPRNRVGLGHQTAGRGRAPGEAPCATSGRGQRLQGGRGKSQGGESNDLADVFFLSPSLVDILGIVWLCRIILTFWWTRFNPTNVDCSWKMWRGNCWVACQAPSRSASRLEFFRVTNYKGFVDSPKCFFDHLVFKVLEVVTHLYSAVYGDQAWYLPRLAKEEAKLKAEEAADVKAQEVAKQKAQDGPHIPWSSPILVWFVWFWVIPKDVAQIDDMLMFWVGVIRMKPVTFWKIGK